MMPGTTSAHDHHLQCVEQLRTGARRMSEVDGESRRPRRNQCARAWTSPAQPDRHEGDLTEDHPDQLCDDHDNHANDLHVLVGRPLQNTLHDTVHTPERHVPRHVDCKQGQRAKRVGHEHRLQNFPAAGEHHAHIRRVDSVVLGGGLVPRRRSEQLGLRWGIDVGHGRLLLYTRLAPVIAAATGRHFTARHTLRSSRRGSDPRESIHFDPAIGVDGTTRHPAAVERHRDLAGPIHGDHAPFPTAIQKLLVHQLVGRLNQRAPGELHQTCDTTGHMRFDEPLAVAGCRSNGSSVVGQVPAPITAESPTRPGAFPVMPPVLVAAARCPV